MQCRVQLGCSSRFGRSRGVGCFRGCMMGPFRVLVGASFEVLVGASFEVLGCTRIGSGSAMVIVQMLLQSHLCDDHAGAALGVLRAAARVQAACAMQRRARVVCGCCIGSSVGMAAVVAAVWCSMCNVVLLS